MKMKSIRKKIPQNVFQKLKKKSGHMAQGKPQLKFERNPYNITSEIIDATDGRITDDGQISIS